MRLLKKLRKSVLRPRFIIPDKMHMRPTMIPIESKIAAMWIFSLPVAK